MKMKIKVLFILGLVFIVSCTEEPILIPKPPTYLRLELPDHSYSKYSEDCPYSFEISNLFKVNDITEQGKTTCHKDIDFGPLNGVMHFSYIEMTEPLATYVNFANDKVGDHKLKATKIIDQQIIRPNDNVFGTFFKLQGDVASPFQFYLTDSTDRFVSGVVYFNSIPKYDSLKPTFDYVEVDLMQMINTFQWK